MMLEIDCRLPNPIISDLVERASKHDCFKGIVVNAQFVSSRVTENEWKNDFVIPPFLKAGNLVDYIGKYGTNLELRDCYGLLSPESRQGQRFSLEDIKKIKS